MSAPNPVDPWADGPRRGMFVTRLEAADPVLRRAAQADPTRQWVMISPEWLRGVVHALAGLLDDMLAGEADPITLSTALRLAAADLYSVMSGYSGALALAEAGDDSTVPAELATFVREVAASAMAGSSDVVSEWLEALPDALNRD